MDSIVQTLFSWDVWSIIIKVLATALLSALVGLACTALGKLIAKCKSSRIRKYAEICVRAAEQKFPNEGKKMGPEKMAYVMDQLAIKFPKIKENTYLYNIAEAAVYELNKQSQQEAAIEAFKEKYGEDPIAITEQSSTESAIEVVDNIVETVEIVQDTVKEVSQETTKQEETKKVAKIKIF